MEATKLFCIRVSAKCHKRNYALLESQIEVAVASLGFVLWVKHITLYNAVQFKAQNGTSTIQPSILNGIKNSSGLIPRHFLEETVRRK